MKTLEYFSDHLDDYLVELRQFVEIETPTGNKEQAERAAAFLTDRFRQFGDITAEQLDMFGPMLRIRRPGLGSRVLLLAHYDTVWPVGSWSQSWRQAEGRVYGPGVYDMKSGLLFILWLLRSIDDLELQQPHIEILLTPDEEVGSLGSQGHVRQAATCADFALVLEPSDLVGSLKLARKGSGDYFVDVLGRSAHQGAEPELGVNAVVEAAHQILRLRELEDEAAGTTVGPNVVEGGTSPNTVPDVAKIAVDVRAWTERECERLDHAIRGLRPVLEGSRLSITGRWNRPPMEPSPASRQLFERARGVGEGLGLAINGVRWGGASDANFASESGAATVDGFGPTGEGAHQPTESIVVDDIPSRLALLTELVTSLTEPPESWMTEEAIAALRNRGAKSA
jgi:glutamate carboxypeptidase